MRNYKRHNDHELMLYSSNFNDEAPRKRAVPMDTKNERQSGNMARSTDRALCDP